MKKDIWKKLESQAGESLAETLIAVLVIAVASMLLASMISASVSIVKKSENSMNEYYMTNESLEMLESGTPATISISVSNEDPTATETFKIAPIDVTYVPNEQLGKHTVIAYRTTG